MSPTSTFQEKKAKVEDHIDQGAEHIKQATSDAVANTKDAIDRAEEGIHHAADKVADAADRATSKASELADRSRELYEDVVERADEWFGQARDYVRKQPVQSVLIALGAGWLLGRFLRR